jgi:hypothetical protein
MVCALPPDRPGRCGPQLRLGDPRQQPVGQGRHRLLDGNRARRRHAAPSCRSNSPASSSSTPTNTAAKSRLTTSGKYFRALISSRPHRCATASITSSNTAAPRHPPHGRHRRHAAHPYRRRQRPDQRRRQRLESAGIAIQVRSYEERSMVPIGEDGNARACAFMEIAGKNKWRMLWRGHRRQHRHRLAQGLAQRRQSPRCRATSGSNSIRQREANPKPLPLKNAQK